ncbi:molybdopterin-dependent oxidoreductase [Methylobacterium oryzihabitans]|uniref:2Fe-2S iron-sulfur cluster binding domain-containing protein n=1 Tax=Methylobacterium oryzihabitans TaxID=2499852 RepID=A0A3S2VLZ9_9HYPH|nr:molybdopterin-dependent oxidoreductase [Methylobacterium oryzihabitans]RVU11977.1 2Fe-2S iron-sulfur cluster binding domain-containing protein [Methylobacterium oryzihabitans]
MARTEKPGFCTLCRSRCGAVYAVEDDRLVSVRPDPSHPTGKALCPKGRAAPEIAHSARRLTTPLRRTAPKGAADPGFVPISWDEALSEVAETLGRYRAETGPESVAFAITSGSSSSTSDSIDWLQRFVRGFGSPNTVFSTEICNWHKDVAHAFTFGCGLPTAEYRSADLILLWGHNPANVWLAQAEAIGAARARGARLAVIDPRRAGSARDADLWLRVRPGTDGALALALARWLIANRAYDADFVRHWTNAAFLVREDDGLFLRAADLGLAGEGFVVWDEASGRAVAASDGLPGAALTGRFAVPGAAGSIDCRPAFDHYRNAVAPYDPPRAEAITGIPAAHIEELASMIAAAGSVCYHGWTGIGQHTNATQTERAIATLYALTGHFDAPGGNVRMPVLPTPPLHSMAMIPAETRARALGLDRRPIGPPADGWITSSDFYDAALGGHPYRVRALFAFGSNLLVSHPAPERGRAALAALDFQVHCDLFLNPTAEMADIVLPVSSPWEHEALRLGFEISPEAQERVQLRPAMIPRQGEARSDMWIVFELARRLGMGDLFFGGDVEKGFAHVLAPLGLDVATLRARPEGVRVRLAHAYRKYRRTGFATQTGKAELYSELLHRHGYPAVPDYVPPAEARSERFPLTLFSVNNGHFRHSQDRGITALRRRREEPTVAVHPALARRKGIAERDWVLLHTSVGRLRMRAAFDDALAEDVVASDYGWWQPAPDLGLPGYLPRVEQAVGSSFNAVISETQRDPLSGSLPLRSFTCDVERLEATAWEGWRSFVVSERREEGQDDVALALRPADGGVLPGVRPGHSVGLRLAGQVRSYSLTGPAVARPDAYHVAVREIAGGLVSGAVRRLRPGKTVELQAPKGGFVLPLTNEFPVVLIAGGIGITPFMSFLETLNGSEGEPEVTLHYGCRDGARQPFRDRLEVLRRTLPNLRVVVHLSRPAPGDRFDRPGRFTVDSIDPALLRRRARFYLCASDAMMAEAKAALLQRGVPPFEIFSERFQSPAAPVPDGLEPRRIVFARSGRSVTWTPGPRLVPILAAAEREGVAIPSGCRVGQCESCVVRIRSGEVRHLVECDDLDEGDCLTCQAVPLSDLVLEA